MGVPDSAGLQADRRAVSSEGRQLRHEDTKVNTHEYYKKLNFCSSFLVIYAKSVLNLSQILFLLVQFYIKVEGFFFLIFL